MYGCPHNRSSRENKYLKICRLRNKGLRGIVLINHQYDERMLREIYDIMS